MDPEQHTALLAARAAAASARAKQSGFRVGAAVLDEIGRVHPGCNVESDSYGLTVCAERVAVFAALAAGARSLVALAVSCPAPGGRRGADGGGDSAVRAPPSAERMPCGACRQIMVEYLAADARVLVDEVGEFSPSELLPEAFRLPG